MPKGDEITTKFRVGISDLKKGISDANQQIKLDELKSGSNEEIIRMAGALITRSMDTVKGLLKDMFPGITDEEIKNTRVSDIAACLVDVVKFTISQLARGIGSKN